MSIVQGLRQHQKLKILSLSKNIFVYGRYIICFPHYIRNSAIYYILIHIGDTGIEREGMGIIIEELGEYHRALNTLDLGNNGYL